MVRAGRVRLSCIDLHLWAFAFGLRRETDTRTANPVVLPEVLKENDIAVMEWQMKEISMHLNGEG
jgi:hypothetical protein